MKKIIFFAGVAVGYVLGTRAGRQRYNQIKAGAQKVWNSPAFKDRVDTATDFVKDKAPQVQAAVTEQAKKVASQVKNKTEN